MTSNRLERETSPYLLQHKDNPVHWWAWGPEALEEAKRTGKPILLSVGYAACHWCHVMAHESFEDDATARLMNDLFVNIKVDREERPDIDALYMAALHRIDSHGGWPLTMFLDSDAKPFWGGTYFPPTARYGKPSFQHVLREVARIFREERDKVDSNAAAITRSLAPDAGREGRVAIDDRVIAKVASRLADAVDPVHGGLNGAPKFPQWNVFWLLWRSAIRHGDKAARQAVITTLDHICQGGIYDHLGGGFARYSVDERWLMPHFEKMLYDNALLLDLMSEVWRETQSPLLTVRMTETVAWLEREMIAEGGGFAASLDADSEGEEGKFYVWTLTEVMDVLGPEDGRRFAAAYDITEVGNFESHNIPNRLLTMDVGTPDQEAALSRSREKLLARRAGRIRPGWDDKVLADWNGLMIAALVNAARALDRPEWFTLAGRAFDFVATRMVREGRLVHAYRAGQAKAPATASDYANMTWAALRLFQATGEARFLDQARRWTDVLDRHHWFPDGGGYATVAEDTRDVIVRMVTAHDDATPNANAIQLTNLVHLYQLTGDSRYIERAEAIPDAFARDLSQSLFGHSGLVAATVDLTAPMQVVVVGPEPADGGLAAALNRMSLPGALVHVVADPAAIPPTPALAGKGMVEGKQTAYVCAGASCSAPVLTAANLREALQRARGLGGVI
jgi:hypothetical protein